MQTRKGSKKMRKLRNRLLVVTLAVVLGVSSVSFSTSAEEISSDVTTEASTEEDGYTDMYDETEISSTETENDETEEVSTEKENEDTELDSTESMSVETKEIAPETTSSIVEINETNFPDPVFREYLKFHYGDSVDTSEVDYIDPSDKENLKSLEGIEFFTEVKTLYVSDCSLSTIDLSKNTKLELLRCTNNSLKSVDTSNCKSLIEFKFLPQNVDAEFPDVTVSYKTHIQSKGWENAWLTNGAISGTVGSAKRLEGIQIVLVPKGSAASLASYGGVTSENTKAFVKK
jgi:hypothetical protein